MLIWNELFILFLNLGQMPMKLSTADRRLLQALQTNVTQSQAELAEEVGLSRTSCWRRIREFEDSGLIRQKVALLDPKLAGFTIEVLLMVAMTEHTDENRRDFETHVQHLPEVLECFSVSGERDYILQVVAHDMDSYTDFLNTEILRHASVRSASSTFVLRRVKYSTKLPLAV